MANLKKHIEISKLFLGYSNPFIHKIMDSSVKYMGAGHRINFHSIQMLDAIEMLYGKKGKLEALLHILIDAKIVLYEFPKVNDDAQGKIE